MLVLKKKKKNILQALIQSNMAEIHQIAGTGGLKKKQTNKKPPSPRCKT